MRCEVAARLVVNAVVNKEASFRAEREPSELVLGDGHGRSTEVTPPCSRQIAWQNANRTRYNAKMRDYMRKRRAASPRD
jgi:hypothetical protein